jgi:chemotaxis protein methyltransferase WspC
MSLLRVEAFVRDRLGIDPGALGPSIFPQAVATRMRVHSVAAQDAYLGILATTPGEVDALAAELVVPETWFFRGGRQLFERLAEFIVTRTSHPVRVLSVPCSTGEEPYSLAITLHKRHTPPEQYHIDALDLSAGHIERAAEGRYTNFSFRDTSTDIRQIYFRPSGDQWQILPQLRHGVHFRTGNIIAHAFLSGSAPYDLILCRNLFIYLTPDGRKQALVNMDRLLAHDGWLCLTPGEADRLPPGRFVQEGPSELGIYRRAGVGSGSFKGYTGLPPCATKAGPSGASTPKGVQEKNAEATRFLDCCLPLGRSAPEGPAYLAHGGSPVTADDSLAVAQKLADAGKLTEARLVCEELLQTQLKSADVYTLLGVIHQAEGRTAEAAQCFRRALYLNPDCSEALEHMIVISEQRGDATQTAALRRRLSRTTREET